jgi:sulfur-oxidizing protein SoxX
MKVAPQPAQAGAAQGKGLAFLQTRRLIAVSVLGALTFSSAGEAGAFECKPKTAGYFKELEALTAAGPSPAEIVGLARSLTGALGDPQRGRSVMISLEKGNCLACHRVAALSAEPSHGNLGPTLNGVGGRYSEAQLRLLVTNAKSLYPNTVMPSYHVTEGLDRVPPEFAGKPILTAAEVEDVIAFLRTLR